MARLVVELRDSGTTANSNPGSTPRGIPMKIVFKATDTMLDAIRHDLRRPHPIAGERVGFVLCRSMARDGILLVLAVSYLPVDDGDYVDLPPAVATIGSGAIRKVLQLAYSHGWSIVHIHLHEHRGIPGFSRIDRAEMARLIPDFLKVRPNIPHGAVVLSADALCGRCWHRAAPTGAPLSAATIVGAPLRIFRYSDA